MWHANSSAIQSAVSGSRDMRSMAWWVIKPVVEMRSMAWCVVALLVSIHKRRLLICRWLISICCTPIYHPRVVDRYFPVGLLGFHWNSDVYCLRLLSVDACLFAEYWLHLDLEGLGCSREWPSTPNRQREEYVSFSSQCETSYAMLIAPSDQKPFAYDIIERALWRDWCCTQLMSSDSAKFALKSISPFQLKISPQTATSAALPPLLQSRSLPTEIPQSHMNTCAARIEIDQVFPTLE